MILRLGALLLLAISVVACASRGLEATPIPAANLLFADQFIPGETGRWHIEGDAVASALLRDEQLVIIVNEPQTGHYTTLNNEIFTDFVLDVETRLVAGNPENSYGVLFRMVEPGQYYRFEVTGNGHYVIERWAAGTSTRLTNGWLDAAQLVQGVGAVNRLQVRAIGNQLAFAINDEVVAEIADDAYAQGNVALDAGTFSRPGIEVAFDNLVITRP